MEIRKPATTTDKPVHSTPNTQTMIIKVKWGICSGGRGSNGDGRGMTEREKVAGAVGLILTPVGERKGELR
jgi:hypothetical protein